MDLEVNEYTYEALGSSFGAAINRASLKLRKEPELKGAIIRDCFITVKCLGYYSKAQEALDKATQAALEGASTEPPLKPEEEEIGSITCPYCKADITEYPRKSLAFTKHMVGECCIGLGEPAQPVEGEPEMDIPTEG
jgi:hypothetical protein